MARRRDPLQIDLTDGDVDGGGLDGGGSVTQDGPTTGAPAEATPGWFATRVAGPLGRRWRGLSRRGQVGLVGGVAVTAVLVAAGVALVDARTEAAHAAHMASMPGGVADLSAPVEETWRVESDAGIFAVLPGGVVATVDGRDVIGIDVADGSELWRTALGEAVDCGPRPNRPAEFLAPVDRLTCLYGADERTAAVLSADGTVLGERAVGRGSRPQRQVTDGLPEIGPAADGAVYVVEHRRESLTVQGTQHAADALEARRAEGTWDDPVLRLEDALTGEVRGEATAELRTAHDLARCSAELGSEGETEWLLETYVWASTSVVQLHLCGVTVTVAPDGSPGGFSGRSVDGEQYEGTDNGTRVMTVDGAERDLPGLLLDPLAVDDVDGPWLVAGDALQAYDEGGEELWVAGVLVPQVAVRAGGVAVVQNHGDGTFDAVDLTTGDVRWSVESEADHVGYSGWLSGAATDGEVALLALGEGTGLELVALRLDDGTELWRSSHESLAGGVRVVDGHLLGVHSEYVVVDDVETWDATLVGLGSSS
ncbi:hypothetical protein GCM10009718_19700 [Isoptericola halotolerans]|uniref:Outer membrane protein assembly factor BamB n=1 Tax=Isoptericola halotolerans TaxID=300560 RepID=A0ABX2A9I8_9MICO|nr:PQQ-binding-like beta-propeller repeat protein [Isoptericola halotolerans]NOV98446.1 outer membrane protein assembly factor BamB [Isoptericola halotolerans]